MARQLYKNHTVKHHFELIKSRDPRTKTGSGPEKFKKSRTGPGPRKISNLGPDQDYQNFENLRPIGTDLSFSKSNFLTSSDPKLGKSGERTHNPPHGSNSVKSGSSIFKENDIF